MNNFFKSTGFLVGATAVLAVGITLVVSELFTGGKKDEPKRTAENCITLNQDDMVNKWLGSGWGLEETLPSILFEPVPGDPIQVNAYFVNTKNERIESSKITMSIQNPETGESCSFPKTDTVGTARYYFEKEDVDPWGDLHHFNFLRIVPVAQPDPEDPTRTVLGFEVYFVDVDGTTEKPWERKQTKPCPPYCPISRE